MFVLHQIGDHSRGLLDSEAVKSLGLLVIFSEIISEIHHFGPLCFAELFQKIGIPKVYYTKAITTKPGLNFTNIPHASLILMFYACFDHFFIVFG